MKNPLKILYIGQIAYGSTALHRLEGMRSLGHDVIGVDSSIPFSFSLGKNFLKRAARSAMVRTNSVVDWRRVNHRIHAYGKSSDWDVLWVDKGQWLRPETLVNFRRFNPSAKLINYSPDDMFNPVNQTGCYLETIGLYDLHVTTKSFGVSEFLNAGARDAYFVGNAYEPSIHRPFPLTDEDREKWACDVCFVGAPEADRNQFLQEVAKSGVHLGLYGGDWGFMAKKYPNVSTCPGFIAGDLYAKVISASKIALGFLRKQNRDQQTQRSIEIPACGTFMLAERTQEHLELFEEGKEAEFFEGSEEMIRKITYYLNHDALRLEIAYNGRMKCAEAGYSNSDRIRQAFSYLNI